MTRTRGHQNYARGNPLGYKRWKKRNVVPKAEAPRVQRQMEPIDLEWINAAKIEDVQERLAGCLLVAADADMEDKVIPFSTRIALSLEIGLLRSRLRDLGGKP